MLNSALCAPTPSEMRYHTQHRAFHRKIAKQAASIAQPEPVAPPMPDPPEVRKFYSDAWFYIESVAPTRTLTADHIKRAVCAHFGLTKVSMETGRRNKDEVLPRQIAMYLCRELTPKGYPEIGRNFGGKDHSTAIFAYQKIKALVASGERPSQDVAAIRFGLEGAL